MDIIKRDGRKTEFDLNKIINAVLAAFQSIDNEISDYAEKKAENIADYIQSIAAEKQKNNELLDVEQIQDLVEKGLMATKRKDVAKAFVLYREERTKERNRKNKLIKEVEAKIAATNIQNQNTNVDEMSFGGIKGEAGIEVMKQYALDYCMSDLAVSNHINNEIYTHDLDSYAVGMHNCLSIPFDDLLANGFNTRQTDVRPANSINTAFQLVAVIFQLQSLQQFGGVSATHLDWTMVPYVRKSFYKHWCDGIKYIENCEPESLIKPEDWSIEDEVYKHYGKAYQYAMDMTIKECQQAVEGRYHNLNTLQSRSGN